MRLWDHRSLLSSLRPAGYRHSVSLVNRSAALGVESADPELPDGPAFAALAGPVAGLSRDAAAGCAVQRSKQPDYREDSHHGGENAMADSSWDYRKYAADSKEENLNRAWNRDSGPGRRFPGPVFWLLLGIALLVVAGIGIGPAVSAARGHGTRGYFVARTERCDRNGCSWRGLFRLPGGQVTRRGVSFFGSESGMHAGNVVPALDTGDPVGVFPRHGDKSWLADLVVGAIGTALIVLSARAWARRRRRALSVTGGSDRSTPPDGPAEG
jgi:hypothetical protein